MNPYKILVYGIGGVGGFFGGKLAAYYQNVDKVTVDFIARGAHKKAIQTEGLQITTDTGRFLAHPNQVSNNPESLGKYDLILLCTKTYDLANSVEQIRSNCTPKTLILPLQNGVDNTQKVLDLAPPGICLEGLVYLIGYKTAPGKITQSGTYKQLMFGSQILEIQQQLIQLEQLLIDSGIEAIFSKDIKKQIWEKYFLISSVGSLSSYAQTPISDLLENPAHFEMLKGILDELDQLAKALNIGLADDIIPITLAKIRKFKPTATSSMQRDFAAGNHTELESLCAYVVKEAEKFGIFTPTMDRIYQHLRLITP